jgi:hypothetical protein
MLEPGWRMLLRTLRCLTGIVALGLPSLSPDLPAQQRTGAVVIQERPLREDPRCKGRGRAVRREAPADRNLNGLVCEDTASGGALSDDTPDTVFNIFTGELFKGQRRGNVGPTPGTATARPEPMRRRDYVSCFGENTYSTLTPTLVIHAAGASHALSGPSTRLCLTRDAIVRPEGETYVLNQSFTHGYTPTGDKGGWRTWVTVFKRDTEGDATPVRSLDITGGRLGPATGETT